MSSNKYSPDFLKVMQRWVALVGITQSAVRLGGQKHKNVSGMRRAAVDFICEEIDLSRLPDPKDYEAALKTWTEKLERTFPPGGNYWGMARKCINIFMRDAGYNYHLRRAYGGLGLLESAFEVPLDSKVGKRLIKEKEGQALPAWKAIVSIKPIGHRQYQDVATKVAARLKVRRADLDMWYFGDQEFEDASLLALADQRESKQIGKETYPHASAWGSK